MSESFAEPPWIAAAPAEWRWVRIAWRRAAAVPGAWFDSAKADKIVALWPTIFKLTEDRFAGQPFHLSLWQEIIVRLLFGWKVPVEVLDPATRQPTIVFVRLFRRLLLWIPRKNGKSEFLAALAIVFYALEGTVGGQGYVFARDEKQAGIPFNKMKAMIAQEPRLAATIRTFKKSLWIAEVMGSFELLTGVPIGKHGRSPTVSLGDEMHEWKSIDIATNIRQGMGARLQPIELFASTAGLKSQQVGFDLFDETRKILDGPIAPPADGVDEGNGLYDPTTLAALFAAEDDDDWRNEAVWHRVNPNIGLSPTIDFLRREMRLARNNPRAESTFRRYHLNQWVESISRWIPVEKWDACCETRDWKTRAEAFRGRRCYGGFDISSTRDITALVWWFPPDDSTDKVSVVCRFWVPEDTIDLRSKVERVDYRRWADLGAIEATPGDFVDQSYVQAAIVEGFEMFEVERIGFDPWNATKLYTDLQAEGMEPERFVQVRQGIPSLGEASKHFEKLVFGGQLDHGGHPVMRWMVGNALIRFDRNMNFAPDKARSREKIDGVAASVTACAVAIQDQPTPPSVYEDRGIAEMAL